MVVSLLSRLAGFSLRNPKTIVTGVLVLIVAGFAVHYKLLVSERDKLRIAEAGYENAVSAFREREAALQANIDREREAAIVSAAERDQARHTLSEFLNARQGDAEALEWAPKPLPAGEINRLCAALPEMEGCE